MSASDWHPTRPSETSRLLIPPWHLKSTQVVPGRLLRRYFHRLVMFQRQENYIPHILIRPAFQQPPSSRWSAVNVGPLGEQLNQERASLPIEPSAATATSVLPSDPPQLWRPISAALRLPHSSGVHQGRFP